MHSTNYTTLQKEQEFLRGLRDFFSARGGEDMQNAYENLLAVHVDCQLPHSIADYRKNNWLEVEYDFNRLFVGPKEVIAPLFASVYLESKGTLMGDYTVQMRGLIHELHLTNPHEGSIPEDFLPYELEVLSLLYALLIEHKEKQALHNALFETIQWLEGHLASWLPLFMAKARSQGACHPHIENVFAYIEYWLKHGLIRFKY